MAEFTLKKSIGEAELEIAGKGVLARWFIKGCDMALYVPAGTSRNDVLTDVPKALEFYYYREIKAEQFATAALKTLQKNWSEKELAGYQVSIDKMHSLYRTVKKGDRYFLQYVQGEGTTLFLNGKQLGTVEGADFASIYFGVWLGEIPLDEKLKAGLLSGL
ncbi:hypothetical protein BVX97_00830 [bacterium E08(2017)]|nr:hypothetical protein BVX97_00830 [bacterium E08(2017)]